MSLKPGDLFFGLMEFLAYIVPGFIFCATLPFIFKFKIDSFCALTKEDSSILQGVIFIMISYVAGHFLHHIAALFLNPLYKKTYLVWKEKKHKGFILNTEKIIDKKIPNIYDRLKASEAYIKLNNPALIPELERHEANSKFFRSLCLLSLYGVLSVGFSFPLYLNFPLKIFLLLILILISVLSFSKFASERWNHRILVYQYFNLMN